MDFAYDIIGNEQFLIVCRSIFTKHSIALKRKGQNSLFFKAPKHGRKKQLSFSSPAFFLPIFSLPGMINVLVFTWLAARFPILPLGERYWQLVEVHHIQVIDVTFSCIYIATRMSVCSGNDKIVDIFLTISIDYRTKLVAVKVIILSIYFNLSTVL